MKRPLCFVLMPFGEKVDTTGKRIDFDFIFNELVQPAIKAAEMESVRAEEVRVGEVVNKAMFERLVLCDYAIADLTTANAQVFYELGVRHAVRPYKTALIFADKTPLPFDIGTFAPTPYTLDSNGKFPNIQTDYDKLVSILNRLKGESITDNPLYQVFGDFKVQTVAHEKTDIFRKQVAYSKKIKDQLEQARMVGRDEVKRVAEGLGNLADVESGIIIDLFLSYRATQGWNEMIELVDLMPKPLVERSMVQEQLAFALNRVNQRERAEKVLLALLKKFGPSSETYGVLGRIYKDQWEDMKRDGIKSKADMFLDRAIQAYIKGFEADWRDFYPGINALTLLEIKDPESPVSKELLPIVKYSIKQNITKGKTDYWDYAALLEFSVLCNEREETDAILRNTIAAVREPWELQTTARNLRIVREEREMRGIDAHWISEIENQLLSEEK